MGPLASLVVALMTDRSHEVVRLTGLVCNDYCVYYKNNAKAARTLRDDVREIVSRFAVWNENAEVISVLCEKELADDSNGVLSEVVLLVSEVAKAKVCAYYRINSLIWSGVNTGELKSRIPTILKEEGVRVGASGILKLNAGDPISLGDIKSYSKMWYRSATAALIKSVIT
ncbi:p19 [Blackberry vein banding-associated virus]|uniref:p19 n=1 Tax=Blackberry vein banding-associated virus TaxID=1381464 RepID=S5U9Q5_9CLOS|nr:p19 [Blackberry vein banding-associated virus]AGS48186.1 p19 [Blackberry vein banding-associated virus]